MATSTTKKKARKLVTKKMKGTKSSNVSKLNGGLEVSCKTKGGDVCKSYIVATRSNNRSTCPNGVLVTNIAMVQDLHCFWVRYLKA